MVDSQVTLAFTADSVRVGRELVRRTLSRVNPQQVEVAVILTDEIVANAVRHGAPPIVLSVEEDEESVTAGVIDGGEGKPVVCIPDRGAESGRGMWIVDALSDAWGVQELPTGKRVWFRLEVPRSST